MAWFTNSTTDGEFLYSRFKKMAATTKAFQGVPTKKYSSVTAAHKYPMGTLVGSASTSLLQTDSVREVEFASTRQEEFKFLDSITIFF